MSEVEGRRESSAEPWIDIHCHYTTPDFPAEAARVLASDIHIDLSGDSADVLVLKGTPISFIKGELSKMTSLETRIAGMDPAKPWIQVISPPTFFVFYGEESSKAAHLASVLNNGMSAATQEYPGRLLAMAGIPAGDARSAVAELERVVKLPGIHGVILGSSVGGRGLDDEIFLPFFEAVESLNLPLFIHPNSRDLAGGDRMQKYFLHNLIGNPTNTTLAACQLIHGGVLDRFPGLRICLAHGGGYLGLASGRLARGYVTQHRHQKRLKAPPEEQLKRFYVDTIVHSAPALNFIASQFGLDRIICGSDYPFEIGDPDPTEIVSSASVSEEERLLMRRQNAVRFLGLDEDTLATPGS